MTWREAQLSLQTMAEERVGTLKRQAAYQARAQEDAAWAAAVGSADGTG